MATEKIRTEKKWKLLYSVEGVQNSNMMSSSMTFPTTAEAVYVWCKTLGSGAYMPYLHLTRSRGKYLHTGYYVTATDSGAVATQITSSNGVDYKLGYTVVTQNGSNIAGDFDIYVKD